MASTPHEIWVELLHEQPEVVVELARGAGVRLPANVAVRATGGEIRKTRPDSLRADLVVQLRGSGKRPVLAVIVEVQLTKNSRKRRTWPVYVTGVGAELLCPALLVVIAPDAGVAKWAQRPIAIGHPGFRLTPIVLGPRHIPVIVDADEACRRVRLAVLSTMAHGRGERAYDVAIAALRAASKVDEPRRGDYYTFIFDAVDESVLRTLEEEMARGRHRELTSIERHWIEKGEAKGRAEGEASARRAMQQGILHALFAREVDVPDAARDRILGETEVQQLETWLVRAVTADRIADVVDD